MERARGWIWLGLVAAWALGCQAESPTFEEKLGGAIEDRDGGLECGIPLDEIFDGGVGLDGIPALTDPELVAANDPDASYVQDNDRVVGIVAGEEIIAIPHNILWWHEIVNFDLGDLELAVTYCPLTGSSIVFDRASVGGAELGVSGLLWRNNLIMYDRTTPSTLFPQMLKRGACGENIDSPLSLFPAAELSWGGWKSLHPDTKVISGATGFGRPYTRYPYGDYEVPDNEDTLFPMPFIDTRLPPKERVFGIPKSLDGGIAYPFSALSQEERRALHTPLAEGLVVTFWDRTLAGAAAYFSRVNGGDLTFEVDEDGRYTDLETGSIWGFDGVAAEGPLAGQSLEGVPNAYVAFWFAWAAFQSETVIWQG